MASFKYVVKDRSGKTSQGFIEAANMGEAAAKLRQDNYFIVQLGPADKKSAVLTKSAKQQTRENSVRGKVNLKDKIFFTKQFYVMLRAGMGMIVCLNNLYEQTENLYLRHIITEIRKDVESGVPLSTALAKFPKVFNGMFVNMIEAGEASGKLDLSLQRLNDFFEREYNLKKKIIGALIYPAIICVVAVAVVIILLTFVVPTFVNIFADSGAQLPGITRALVMVSDILRNYWYLLMVFVIGLGLVYKVMGNNPKGREKLDQFWINFPQVGDLIEKVVISRFARTLATLLDSGVPLLQSLEIVQRAVSNAVIARGIRHAATSVNQGTGLARPLLESGVFPVMVPQMVAIGEDTGDINHMLEEVADYYDKEVSYALENLTAMIEPLIIVGLGGVVAFIVAAIMLPMFDISTGATLR